MTPRHRYVQRLLDLYCCTPHTSGFARPTDRRLAASLHDRHVPLHTVYAALLLATGRRALRPTSAPPLAKIASLHYFLPVIDEILATPLDPAYVEYLRRRLAPIAPALAVAAGPQLP